MNVHRTLSTRPHRLLAGMIAIATVTTTITGCAVPTSESGAETPVATEAADSDQSAPEADEPTSEAAEPEPPAPNPDGTITSSCDYVLGDFTSNTKTGFRFLADAQLENTGNIGTVTRVKAAWYLSGGDQVTKSKKVRVKADQSKRTGFVVPVGQDEIDRHQSLGFDAETCKVTATIIDTFGQPS